ncbi:MAG: hydroxyacid dehydrogenase [Rubrivivax sp.]|nr:hydroxyacid dehydrogenase [Rubrivivax sp.]
MPITIFLTFDPAARALYYGDKALAALRALGEVRLHESPQALDGAALAEAARGCHAIVSDRRTAASEEFFAACGPELAVFLRCAVDIRNIDVDAASARGVLVTQASAGFANAVAEWVVGALIDLSRGFSEAVLSYRAGTRPRVAMGRELRGSTIGIVGYGRIGRRVAELAQAFGMRVLVADPLLEVPGAAGAGAQRAIEPASIEDLLAAADHVVCLAPALPETENLFDARRFAQMKPGSVFVNAARGNLVDEAALVEALESGHLAGCALDVGRAPDQMPSPALAAHPLVIATPHIGGLTPAAVEHQALETVAQLAELLRGGMPRGAVNPQRASRLAALRTV